VPESTDLIPERVIVDESDSGIPNPVINPINQPPQGVLEVLAPVRLDPSLERKIQAEPVRLDPRLAQKFLNIPKGVQLGPSEAERAYLQSYIQIAKMKSHVRAVYSAIKNGYSNAEDIESVTGLTQLQIRSALKELVGKGFIQSQ
jgi:hypothetical protein